MLIKCTKPKEMRKIIQFDLVSVQKMQGKHTNFKTGPSGLSTQRFICMLNDAALSIRSVGNCAGRGSVVLTPVYEVKAYVRVNNRPNRFLDKEKIINC